MNSEQVALAQQRFSFDSFDPSTEEWAYYIERFECELAVFNLRDGAATERARRTLLLSKVGKQHFRLLVDHFKPRVVHDVTYDELKAAINANYAPRSSVMVDRVHFSMRFRRKGESVTQFVNALRGLAGKCDFGSALCERLRDQIVIGINNLTWQQDLLRQFPSNDATLQQVEEAATRLELAECQLERLQTCTKTSEEIPVNRLRNKPQKRDGNRRAFHRRRIDPSKVCLRCGGQVHLQNSRCPAEGKKCYQCGGMGHLASVCVTSGRAEVSRQKQTRKLNTVQGMGIGAESDEWTSINVIMTHDAQCHKAVVTVTIEQRKLKMLFDPGAAFSVIDKATWDMLGRPPLKEAADLVAYTNVPVRTVGKAKVMVHAFGKKRRVEVHVVNGTDSPLFGLDWCLAFGLPFPQGVQILKVSASNCRNDETGVQWEAFLNEFADVFNREGGAIIGHQATVHVKENAIPKAFKARPVPFALREQVENEIHRMLDEDILEPVDTATDQVTWASPIVCVVKPSGKVRICGDFKVTINPHVIVDRHPLPTFEDMTAKLNGGVVFSVIDLKDAYLQMVVAPSSRQYLVIATHLGFYRFKRLPFGVSFAPALFQKTMEQILTGLEGVAVYIDDIIICSSSREEHLERLRAVFLRLRQSGLRVHKDKCKFLQSSVNYLGHRIDANGIHPTEERIEAITNMPEPTNVRELRSFLGAMNYYARFIPHLQSRCASLHELTKAGTPWKWNQRCKRLFAELKSCLTSSDTLVHYDGKLPLVLSTDACERGLGAVLCHRFPTGMEKPIAFASRLLTDVEKRYAAIDKEALAIMFGVSKFAQYLYGRHFTLKTDHKPLERIFGSNRELPKLATNRLMRWALILGNYEYSVEYVPASRNAPADVLSRLPIGEGDIPVDVQQPSGQLLNLRIGELPLSKRQLQRCLIQDRVLAMVIRYLGNGWPCRIKNISEELKPFFERRSELSYEDKVLLWQGRIVVPTALRPHILETLHEGHPGIVAMKSVARFHVWWPGLAKDIEKLVNGCLTCQRYQRDPPEVPLVSWNVPSEPWSRIHLDLAGPFKGNNWLVAVDAYSKWLDVFPLRSTTSSSVIRCCRRMFASFGLPRHIVTDNGPQFASDEFKQFCEQNGIVHIRSTPYHPRTNGLAERAIRTFKERMNKAGNVNDLELDLQRFLFSYRNTPHTTTGRAPAELLFGRRLRSKLDLLKPSLEATVDTKLFKQALYHDQKAVQRSFKPGDKVFVRQPDGGPQQVGQVVQRTSQTSYRVNTNGKVLRKHADHLRFCEVEESALRGPATEAEGQSTAAPTALQSDCLRSERPKRTVKPPSLPYDKYLADASLK